MVFKCLFEEANLMGIVVGQFYNLLLFCENLDFERYVAEMK